MRARILFAAGLLFAGAVAADAQSVSVDKLSCLPTEKNGVVWAAASAAAGQTLRLYFRWMEHEDFYWVVMEPAPNGRFWAVPPKPEKRNEHVELYAALVDPAGKVAARSEPQMVKVGSDCRVQLSAKEQGVADNLTVGETSPKQQGKKVLAFLCDGIVTRINSEGVRRSDEVCRACVIAWWQRKAVVIPAAAAFVGIVITDDGPEPSPSRP